jgi:hypothetical protein
MACLIILLQVLQLILARIISHSWDVLAHILAQLFIFIYISLILAQQLQVLQHLQWQHRHMALGLQHFLTPFQVFYQAIQDVS